MTTANEAITSKRARRLELCPASARSLLARRYSRKASPRQAVKAFCQECCGYDRAAIRDCTAFACQLWNLRPYQQREAQ